MNFGLGLVLSFTDNATAGLSRAISSLHTLTMYARDSVETLGQLAEVNVLSSLSLMTGQLGQTFYGMGNGIMGMFQRIIQGTMQTGSDFENLRITVNALLKDTEKAEDAISKLMNFAATTPFEVNDLTGMFTTITANGLDAFKELTSAKNGFQQGVMGFIGDLMAFRPEVPAVQWSLAIRNAFSGDLRSLRNALDVNVKDILGREWGKTAEQVAQDFADLADNLGVAGLMMKNMGTWKQVLANVSDQFTRLFLAIADNGVFADLKLALMNVTNALFEMTNTDIENFAKVFSESINFIVQPIIRAGQAIGNLIRWITNLVKERPKVAKLVIQLTAFAGVLLTIIGVGLKLISSLSGLAMVFVAMGSDFTKITKAISGGIKTLMSRLVPLSLMIGAMYLAWKYDFAGIRTIISGFITNVANSFFTARRTVNGSVSDMVDKLALLRSTGNAWDTFTIGLMDLMIILRAVGEAWDDFTLSEDTFLKAKELGVLPLIEAILDLKYRFSLFVSGFVNGVKTVSNQLKEFLMGLEVKTKGTFLEDAINNLTKFFELLSSNDADAWYKLGESFGTFATRAAVFFAVFKTLSTVLGGLGKILGLVKGIGTGFKTASRFAGGLFNGVKGAVGIVKVLAEHFGTMVQLLLEGGKFIDVLGAGFPATTGRIAMFVTNIGNAFSKVWKFFGLLGKGFGGIITGITSVLTFIGTLVTGFLGAFGIIISAPAWLVGAITVAIIAIFALIIHYREEIWSAIKQLGTWIGDFFSNLWNSDMFAGVRTILEPVISTVKGIFDAVATTVKSIVDTIVSFFQDKWDKIVETFGIVKNRIIGFGKEIEEGFKSIFNKIKEYTDPMVETFNDLKDTLGEFVAFLNGKADELKQALAPAFDFIAQKATKAFNDIRDVVTIIWQGIWGFIGPIITTIAQVIGNGFSLAFQTVSNILTLLFDIVRTLFTNIFGTIMNILSSLWQGVVGVVKGAIDVVLGIVKGLFTTIANILMSIMDLIMGDIDGAAEHMGKAIGNFQLMFINVWNGIKTAVGSILEAIGNVVMSVFDGIWGTITGIIGNILTYLKTQFGDMLTTASNNLNAFKNMFTNIFDNVKDTVKNALNYITNKFKNLVLALPSIKLPHFKISGSFSAMPPSVPKVAVDWYAKGGVFNRPSVIGVGEDGQEAVMPLENNTGWIGVLASKIGGYMAMSKSANDTFLAGAFSSMVGALSGVSSAISTLIPVSSQEDVAIEDVNLKPSTSSVVTNTEGDTTSHYLTNNTSNTNQGSVDNSVTFGSGAIQINVQNATPQEAENLAQQIMAYIKRQQQLDSISKYKGLPAQS